ncbi:DUF4221 family protein [Algoriphagus aquimarinus]|uniref:DUF4221 domain-containing protein n=1 Tax=Algoriphagus aquimarinus TaxID=237018 RepID=A0A1I0VXJ6_9BACT|nr:DUF4221 family protein [Algoriphagus aquimarinus]SFA80650.1 protein of unknown function [Algoriphagus aquimarinus]
MRKLTLLNFLALCILGSCSTKTTKQIPVLDLKDLIVDTLYLEKDTLTKNLGSHFSFYETDSGKILATYLNHQLLVYSYPEGKLLKSQTFEKEGPDGIGSFITGNFIDKNSIYFLSQQKELIQSDLNGNVLERWDLPAVTSERKYANYSSYLYNNLQKSGNELYFVDIPFVFQDGFENYDKWGMVFNTETDSFSNYHFLYPRSITEYTQDDQLGLFSHVFNPKSKEHLIGFSISDSIAIVKNGKQSWKWAGTTSPLEFKKGETIPSGEYTVFQPNHESSKYEALDLDTYAKKIIRWVRLKGPNKDYPDRQEYRLLVFDQEFNPEAEIKFNIDELAKFGFNTPKGYALSLYTKTTDDIVAYAVIDFSKINNAKTETK